MIWKGVLLAVAAACTHTAIDTLRKHASATLPSAHLVTLVALLDAVLSCSGVALLGGFRDVVFEDPTPFAVATVTSSALLLVSKFLYQRALQLSPLSLTIPYTSFTPAILVVTAYLFLGEKPSVTGLCGVAIVAFGGYLLSLIATGSPVGSGSSHAAHQRVKQSSLPAGRAGQPGGNDGELTSGLSAGAGVAAAAAGGGPLVSTPSELRPLKTSKSSSAFSTGGIAPAGSSGTAGAGSVDVESQERRKVKALKRALGAVGANGLFAGAAMRRLAVLQQEPGTLMMMAVAAIWSVTASLDKIGLLHAPSIWVYFALQRALIGAASGVYLLLYARHALLDFIARPWLLLAISVLELSAVVLFLKAIRFILVSYVVAIKRCNILFSVLMGGLIFKENILSRMPFIFLMLFGVMLIVLEPNALIVHHGHTTRQLHAAGSGTVWSS